MNKINKNLTNQRKFSLETGKHSLKSVAVLDDFMKNIVIKIKTSDIDNITSAIMTMIKAGNLEQVNGNLYKYKEFHILELLKRNGIDYSNKLKTLDKLNLNITQKHIETIEKDERIYIITQISGTEKRNLIPLRKYGTQNISKKDKLATFHDLQKLTKAGLIDDKVANSNKLWFVNSNNKIIIPTFAYLRPIAPNESKKDIVEKYYNILFK